MDSSGASSRRSKNIRMTRSFVSWSYLVRMPHSLLSRGRRASIKARAVHSPHWRTRAHVALALASQAGHAVLPLLREAVAREDHATARDAMAEAIVRAEASIEYAAQLKN